MLLGYLGPETMLPMTSVVAGALGFLMMFGRKGVDLVRGLFGRKQPAAPTPQTRARGHRPTASRVVTPSAQRQAVDSPEVPDSAVN